MAKGRITIDELQAEYDRLEQLNAAGPKGAFTSCELGAVLGKSRKYISDQLRTWVLTGFIRYAGTKRQQTVDGRVCWLPAYWLMENGKCLKKLSVRTLRNILQTKPKG